MKQNFGEVSRSIIFDAQHYIIWTGGLHHLLPGVSPAPCKQALNWLKGSWNITSRKLACAEAVNSTNQQRHQCMEKMILLATVYSPAQCYNLQTLNSDKLKRLKLNRQSHEVNPTISKNAVEFCLPDVCVSTKFSSSKKFRACPMKGRYIIFSQQATGGSSWFL